MEPETCTAAQEEVSDKAQNVRDSPPTTGEKSDEGQQIISERNIYWYRTTLALDYLQPAFLLIVKDEMKTLQEEIQMYFERKLCVEATANDIKLVNNTRAEFSHICTARPYECQTLIYLILQHIDGYVQSYEMVKGTDPQKWLTSPFEFVRLFLEDWMRRDIHDFPECDITALCGLVNSCKPLKNMFAPTNIDKVRTARNRTMHKARLNIDQQEMQKYIGEILDFLQRIKTLPTKALRNTDEITKAIDIIEKLRIGDVRILPGIVVQLIQGWLSSARRQFAHENDVVDTLRQNIVYMENELARLTSGQEAATTMKKAEEMTFQTKIEKLTDENQKLKQQTEDMAKVIEELNKRRETMESRSVGEVCRPKAIPTQRSPGQPEYMTPDFSIPVDSGNDLDIDPPSGDGDGHKHTESLTSSRYFYWYTTVMALTYLQPVLASIIRQAISSLHEETVTRFGRKLCAKATSDDILRSKGNTAKFEHMRPSGTSVACQALLDIIKHHTVDSVIFFEMIIGTDPQTWLDSPIDFACLFIDKPWRGQINDFEDCDLTVLCQIVKRCKPLMLIFKEKLAIVSKVRNQTMHAANMNMTQKEMEENLAALLEFLEYVKLRNDTEEVNTTIDCIQQLQSSDRSFFLRKCSEMMTKVLTDAKMKCEPKQTATNQPFPNIVFVKGEQENNPETSNTEDKHEGTAKHGQSQPSSSGNEQYNLPSTTSGIGSSAIERQSKTIDEIQFELVNEVSKMDADEPKAFLLKFMVKDHRLILEVFSGQITITNQTI